MTPTEPRWVVRPARPGDETALGVLGAALLRAHHRFDARRFMAPPEDLEQGYAQFLGAQFRDDEALVLVAERAGVVEGYVYATLEGLSWKELRDAAGFIHDVVVAEGARGLGIGPALVEEACLWLRARGAPRVLLLTADANSQARQLFARLGFRPTMVEMTREL